MVPAQKKIYSVLTKDSLYVYTVTTEAFLTGDDFIDDTKPATADTMKKKLPYRRLDSDLQVKLS